MRARSFKNFLGGGAPRHPYDFRAFSARSRTNYFKLATPLDVDVPAEFAKLHRPRSRPRRLDDNPESAVETSMMKFYDREFKEALDILITQYKDNINASLEKVKALSIILQPPLSSQHKESDVKDLLNLFPHQAPDQAAFSAEFEVFSTWCTKETQLTLSSHWRKLPKKLRSVSTFSR